MKICLLTEIHLKGGLDTFIINLINAWPEERDEIILMCNAGHRGIETIKFRTHRPFRMKRYYRFFTSKIFSGDIDFRLIKHRYMRRVLFLTYQILANSILFFWYVTSILLNFHMNKYDRLIVINGGYPASLLCRAGIVAWKLSGNKNSSILNFHNTAIEASTSILNFPNFIDKLILNCRPKIISVSKNTLESLEINRPIFKFYENKFYIHNGIDNLDLIKNYGEEKIIIHPRDYFLVLASYEPRKGHEYLINAFKIVAKELNDVDLLVYGDCINEYRSVLNKIIIDLKLQKRIFLREFSMNVIPLLRNSRCLLVPSQEFESFGLVIIEAMALGIPVITTDVGGIPEIMKKGNFGFKVSKSNHKEFAEAMLVISSLSRQEVQFLRHNAKTTYEKYFTAKFMAQQYYHHLLSN